MKQKPITNTPNLKGIQPDSMSQNQAVAGMVSESNINIEGLTKGEYSFALNARLNALTKNGLTSGELGSITVDMGNIATTLLPSGYSLLAATYLKGTDDEFFVMLYNKTTGFSQIGLQDGNQTYTTLVDSDTCLGFTDINAIKVISSIYKGTDRIVFWTDDNEKPKYFNIDDPDSFKDTNGDWICDAFNQQRTVEVLPKINLDKVLAFGGLLQYGTYLFFIRFLSNENSTTEWLSYSNQIPIVNSGSTYEQILGSYNASSDLDRYGLSRGNSAIKLSLKDLDYEGFTHYQLGVLEYTAGTGVVQDAYILKKRLLDSATDSYTYTGNSTLVDSITTQEEFIIPSVRIDQAASIATVDNRLILANTKNTQYDWGKFQIAVNNASVNYIVTKVKADDLGSLSTKTPSHYDKGRSLMRDEVYGLGVVFYMGDLATPVFHIAGRPKDGYSATYGNSFNTAATGGLGSTPNALFNWDSDVVNNNDSTSFGANAERWQVYNTAIKNNTFVGQLSDNGEIIVASGEMGYYETSDVTYPDTKDMDDNLIYPNTNGVMDKVRHHRMPHTNLEYHASDDITDGEQYIYPLGLLLTDMALPTEYADKITGYAIVIANKQSENDYTVVDKGLMTQPFYSVINDRSFWNNIVLGKSSVKKGNLLTHSVPFTRGGGFDICVNIDDSFAFNSLSTVGLDTPQSRFNKTALNFDYIKIEGLISTGGDGLEELTTSEEEYRASAYLKRFERFPATYTSDYNYKIDGSEYVNYNTAANSMNLNVSTPSSVNFKGFQGYAQGAMFAGISGYGQHPYNQQYGDVGDEGYAKENFNIYGRYVALKNNITDVHANLEAILYRKFSETSNITNGVINNISSFNGDAFISKWDVRRSIQNPNTDDYVWKMTDLDDNTSSVDKTSQAYLSSNMTFFVESRINAEYRSIGAEDHESYYSFNNNVINPASHLDANLTVDAVDEYVIQEDFQEYNIDYSNTNDVYTYFPVSDEYDARYYTNDLKYRVWYSERYINGDILDNRLNILANNYTELPIDNSDQNGITDVFVYNNELYVHTNKTMFALPTNAQRLTTNDNVVYVGQGDFLSIPPRAINSVEYGYAGSAHFNHKRITEHGVLFVDSNRKKIFLFNNKLDELNSKKQSTFFNYNLDCKFLETWRKEVSSEYPNLNATQSKAFIGYVPFYDKIYNRMFVSKRDFEFNVSFEGLLSEFDFKNSNAIFTDLLFYDDEANEFVTVTVDGISNPILTTVDFTNTELFINKSFTMSYSLHTGLWTSYHSYSPNYVFEDNTTFYSWISDSVDDVNNNVWVHEDEWDGVNVPVSSYYGNKYPHMVEFTVIHGNNDVINQQTFNAFNYIGTAHYNSDTNLDRLITDKTFNEILIYNTYQNTGVLDLVVFDKKTNPYQNYKLDNTQTLVFNDNVNSWNINGFRDISLEDSNLDIHSTEWSDLLSYYNGTQGFIDKVPANINYNKNVYERRRIKDRFARVRLMYDYNNIQDITSNTYDDLRLTTNVFVTNTTNSKLK
jgi:hypothetical protein